MTPGNARTGFFITPIFSSDTLIRHVPDEEHLVYYKLNHQDAFREVNFYYKRSRYMPKVVSAFLDMI